MLSAALRKPPRALVLVVRRGLATEPVAASSTSHEPHQPPPPPSSSSKHPAQPNSSSNSKPRSHLYPQPRPAISHRHTSPRTPLPKLPPTFGRNQFLPVADSTRALLESIVAKFHAPIRYVFAYGSGVFEQDGRGKDAEAPMLDFMFAVTHPAHFHYINMQQYPGHYPLHARVFGSSYVGRVEELGPGVWFNAYVPMNGVVSFPLIFFSLDASSLYPNFLLV